MSGNIISASWLSFTEADWERIPNPGNFSVDEVMDLFVGPVEKNGRQWALASLNNDDLREVFADGQVEVRLLDDEDMFAHPCINVDSSGVLKYEMFLESLTKTYPREGDDGQLFAMIARLPITTQLTPEELTNSIVRAVQSNLSFEQEEQLFRENEVDYYRRIGIRNAQQLLLFIRPERVAEFQASLEQLDDTHDDSGA